PLSVSFSQAFQVANAAQYYWNFGDGHTSTERFPTHTYTETGNYNVSIQFFDAAGNWLDSIGSVGSVSVRGPTAGFSIIQSNCQAGQVDFADSSRNANSWFWDFGDGNTSNDTVPHHSYAGSVSNYIVTQTVTDTNGCSNSISALMFANTQSPVLVTETDICGLDTVHFFTSQVNYASYVWHFGDGTSDTSANPSHVYTIEGVFTPRLVTTDLNGCTKEYFAPAITVSLPTADFTTSARQGCDRLNVAFFNHSLNADSLNCVYEWDFGDGNYSNAIEPVHRYMGAGTYTVTLTVYKGNCISRETRPNHIKVDTAFAGFVATPLNRCMPMSVQFTNYSANAVSYHWDFGDGTTDTIADPLHVFNSYTYTNMVLAIVDANGCRDTARRLQFTPMNPEFTIDAVKGCIPFTVHFDDNTAMVSSYLWDFGDGSTSTLADPAHTYYQSGTYDIRLIVTSGSAPGGCSDTVYMPAYIKAVDPVADFRTNDTLICAPGEVHFTDLSRDGDAYLWDFGDGTTSNRSDSISHIYNLPGVYTVTLTVSSDAGCSHSKTISQYIRVYGSTSMFEASAYEGCAPFTVDFTDLSSQNSIAWEYTFGDGGSDTISDPTHTFLSGGVYNVRLLTRDEHGCGSYYELPDPIIVHEQPIADFSISDTVGCQPFVLDLTNHSTGYEYLSWDFGNGMTDSSFEPEFAYVQTGSFNVSLIAYNTYGCADTMHHPSNITVQLTPVPSFTVGMTTGCIGLTTQFSSNSTNISNPVYFWDFGNNSTSDQPSVSVTYDRPGNYTVSLEVTNDNGCSAETTLTGLIHVYDTVPPSKTVVNSVSVEDNTHVKIIWQNNPDLDLFSYVVYRLNRGANLYEAVHTQPASNNSFALTSSWTDEGLNTLSETYSYKVQAVDVCGYYYPLDSLTAHTTINVSSEEAGNHIAVSWTSYGGCQVGTYKIFRAAPGESMEYLATVPGDNLDYLDSTFSCPYPYSYRIMATDLCGTLYTSYSDTSVTMPKNIYDGQVVDVVRSTVVDNRYVLTEWKETTVLPESVVAYEIYRSTDNQEYSFLMSVPAQQTDLQDYDVDVQTTRYYYRIKVVNRCDVDMGLSKTTSTIILNGNMDEGRRVYLDWTPYSGWENGVEYYILEKQDANGNWIFLRQVTGQVTNYDYQE
ncbi:MAG: PKD domain-containing protein, partial [Bacteroidota bacterium]